MNGETPVLDTLADITAASIENNSLGPREFMLARLAALIAVDAPPAFATMELAEPMRSLRESRLRRAQQAAPATD